MKIRAMIAEDELMARKELMYLLKAEKDIILTPHAETGEQLIELYHKHHPDVIFLDVEMPGLSGVDAARSILKREGPKPLFVFTTAYDEYALDAFDVEAVDYLLKPYDEARFQRTLGRIRKSLDHRKKKNSPEEIRETQAVSKLLIDDGERMVVVSPESIYYAVPNRKILEIHTEEKVLQSRMTLRELEEQLKGHPFFRPHRSYLVNLNHVIEITPWFNGTSNLTLGDKNRTKIPVSRQANKMIRARFSKGVNRRKK
ncbi:MAG: DNA-binding response regulator [Bacillaceae bacterium]|nr:DNA-binding response regulator [Bacillaceae bacterium]